MSALPGVRAIRRGDGAACTVRSAATRRRRSSTRGSPAKGEQIRRRRECLHAASASRRSRRAELVMPRVVKSDASREPFDEAKLRSGMLKALEKRPVATRSRR